VTQVALTLTEQRMSRRKIADGSCKTATPVRPDDAEEKFMSLMTRYPA